MNEPNGENACSQIADGIDTNTRQNSQTGRKQGWDWAQQQQHAYIKRKKKCNQRKQGNRFLYRL